MVHFWSNVKPWLKATRHKLKLAADEADYSHWHQAQDSGWFCCIVTRLMPLNFFLVDFNMQMHCITLQVDKNRYSIPFHTICLLFLSSGFSNQLLVCMSLFWSNFLVLVHLHIISDIYKNCGFFGEKKNYLNWIDDHYFSVWTVLFSHSGIIINVWKIWTFPSEWNCLLLLTYLIMWTKTFF